MNWADLIIVLIFVVYILAGYHRGFFRLSAELLSLVLAFSLALKLYPYLSQIFGNWFKVGEIYGRPISFLLIWFLVQILFWLITQLIAHYTPKHIKRDKMNYVFAFVPSIFKGIIFIAVFLIMLVALPLDAGFKNFFAKSFLGGPIIKSTTKFSSDLEVVFGGQVTDTLTFAASPSANDFISLEKVPEEINIQEEAESKMLEMVNQEREKNNLKRLQLDENVRQVARLHSLDMFKRKYFSHITPEGKSPFDRLLAGNIKFKAAGENIALVSIVELGHIGFMNSPEHRANILEPSFTKIGIGVIDGGDEGLMITQNFIN